jgi:hypothetical protein
MSRMTKKSLTNQSCYYLAEVYTVVAVADIVAEVVRFVAEPA